MASFQRLLPIERPLCPRSRSRMTLAQASAIPDRKEKRIFECAKCRFMEIVTVPDPLQSDSIQWLAGELRPPE
jgi:hypothetical protein